MYNSDKDRENRQFFVNFLTTITDQNCKPQCGCSTFHRDISDFTGGEKKLTVLCPGSPRSSRALVRCIIAAAYFNTINQLG